MSQTQAATSQGGESFAALFEESLKRSEMRSGEVITAEVVRVDYNFVVVNAGLKSEAYVPIEEFKNDQGELEVQVGDFVSVAIDAIENGYGDTILSRDKAKRLASWLSLEKALESGEFVIGTVNGKVKGGLTVLVNGIRAFLPGSLLDTRPVKDMTPFEGKTMDFKVIKLDRKRNNVVLSRRAVVEASMGEERAKLLETLTEGAIVNGVVKNITEYGAFVDLGGIDGLLHITDMSWGRVNHPSELFQVGDKVKVKVLKFNSDSERVSLGLKQITADPWVNAETRYIPGTVVEGKVVSIKDYGAFVELEEGIEGLVHVSEMSWTRQIKNPKQILKIGDEVRAVVLDIDVSQNRISLGMKQLEENPYDKVLETYPPGAVVEGVIRNIADFGVFVELEPGIDGLVHITDLSWTQRVRHPSELFKKGDKVRAMVLNIDNSGEKPKISLGLKQLAQDPWDRIPYDFPIGKIVEVKILKLTDFGAFAELEPGIEGLIHISEISEERVEDPRTHLEPGQKARAEIIQMDAQERKIGLSIKSARRQDDLADAQGFTNASEAGATLGDVFAGRFKDRS